MAETSSKRAILFADVCNSTGIYESVGDARALALVNRLFAQLAKRVKAAGGAVVKTLGDGMVCQFKEPEAALRAASAMQAATGRMPLAGQHKLEIRVGTTWGPVVVKNDDVFGDTVNVCAKLQALANPQQVLTTRELVEALPARQRARCRQLYPTRIRGRAGEVMVFEVLWREDPDLTQMNLAPDSSRPGLWILKLTYGGQSFTVGPAAAAKLGRDKANDVVVASTLASRVHAHIFSRDGNYFIADQSSNGTFLLADGNTREVRLRREEALMGERGWIGLGKPASNHGAHCLRYRLERRSA
ncbi:MAG: adenylate/guanylate cyclase domain-containing protein [Betaproteobacteria bacterium]